MRYNNGLYHVGLTLQRHLRIGEYRLGGPERGGAAPQPLTDALVLEKTGTFALVLEYINLHAVEAIARMLSILMICIESEPKCDDQVLVLHDPLGLTCEVPPFAERCADLSKAVRGRVSEYAREVRERAGSPGRSARPSPKGACGGSSTLYLVLPS